MCGAGSPASRLGFISSYISTLKKKIMYKYTPSTDSCPIAVIAKLDMPEASVRAKSATIGTLSDIKC